MDGQGFCLYLERELSVLCPAVVGAAAGRWGLGAAIGLHPAGASGLLVLVALMLRETRGQDLAALRKVADLAA